MLLASLFGRVIVGISVNEQRMRALGFPYVPLQAGVLRARRSARGHGRLFCRRPVRLRQSRRLSAGTESGGVLMMVILGGMGTLHGAVLGAFASCCCRNSVSSQAVVGGVDIGKHWQLLMGGFIVFAVLLLPHGLLGLGRLASRLRQKPEEARDG